MNFFNPMQFKPQNSFNQQPQFDPAKFQQGVQNLTKEHLVQLVQQARAQGIPDSQIEAGLNYILNSK
jgi:hypothetical protein